MTNKQIAEKWYKKLDFPKEMQSSFRTALDNADIPEGLSAQNAPYLADLGTTSVVWALYFLENMEAEYEKRGIRFRFGEDIQRIRSRILNTFNKTGGLDIGDLTWDRRYFMAREFKLGILTFTLGRSPLDIPERNLLEGDPVLQIHVHGKDPLLYDECVKSLALAKEFVKVHFPDFKYKYFTCLSWLLDDSIADLLGEGSNILKFGTLFDKVRKHESDNILRFVFGGTTRATLPGVEPKNRFQRELKTAALAGRTFYDVRGLIDPKIDYGHV